MKSILKKIYSLLIVISTIQALFIFANLFKYILSRDVSLPLLKIFVLLFFIFSLISFILVVSYGIYRILNSDKLFIGGYKYIKMCKSDNKLTYGDFLLIFIIFGVVIEFLGGLYIQKTVYLNINSFLFNIINFNNVVVATFGLYRMVIEPAIEEVNNKN